MSEKPPAERLDDDHVEWVIDGQKRSVRIKKTYRFLFKVMLKIGVALKWIADSLKWAVPLFLAFLAWGNGTLDSVIAALKEYYG